MMESSNSLVAPLEVGAIPTKGKEDTEVMSRKGWSLEALKSSVITELRLSLLMFMDRIGLRGESDIVFLDKLL